MQMRVTTKQTKSKQYFWLREDITSNVIDVNHYRI